MIQIFQNYYGNVIFERTVERTVKIGQSDLHRVVALKRFTKGAMISSFRGAPCTKPSARKTAKKMQSLMELLKVLLKFAIKTFQKQSFTDVLQNRCS